MASYHGPKARVQRRFGEVLVPRTKYQKIVEKRGFPPGDHGKEKQFRSGRRSDFGMQLNEKQKLSFIFNVREGQMRRYFLRARRQTGNTGENLLRLLEMRLDNVVYRFGLAITRAQARQMVNHAQFDVNGQKVDIPSYTVKPNDIVTVRKSKKQKKQFVGAHERVKKAIMPSWLNFDASDLSGKVLHEPKKEDLDQSINSQLIVEFHSR